MGTSSVYCQFGRTSLCFAENAVAVKSHLNCAVSSRNKSKEFVGQTGPLIRSPWLLTMSGMQRDVLPLYPVGTLISNGKRGNKDTASC